MTNINNIEKNYVITSVFVTIFITFLSTFLIINNLNDVFASFAGGKSVIPELGTIPLPPLPQHLYLFNQVSESLKNNDIDKALTDLKLLKQELSIMKGKTIDTSTSDLVLNDVIESLNNNDKDKALTYLKLLGQELSTLKSAINRNE